MFLKKNRLIDTVLLESPSVTHRLSPSSHIIDLIDLCRVITISQPNDWQCISSDLPKDLFFSNCSVSGMDHNKSYNFTVNFSNQSKNKTCKLYLFAFNYSVTNSKQNNKRFNYLLEGSYELNDNRTLAYENIFLKKSDFGASHHFTNATFDRYMQLNYLLTIPLLHGLFEGCIDAMRLHARIKLFLKIGLSLLLVNFNFFSNLQFMFLIFYYIIEFLIKKNLTILPAKVIYDIELIFFLIVTELEYGFSNLWVLANKPIFWSAFNEHLNKYFLQLLWTPIIKSTGYLISSYIIDFISQLICRNIHNDATSKNTQLGNTSQLGEATFF